MAGARCPGWGQRPAPRKTSACSRSVSFVLPPSHTFPAQSKHRGEGARPLAQFGSPAAMVRRWVDRRVHVVAKAPAASSSASRGHGPNRPPTAVA